jgi:hypothetical protein
LAVRSRRTEKVSVFIGLQYSTKAFGAGYPQAKVAKVAVQRHLAKNAPLLARHSLMSLWSICDAAGSH